jgi:hypothetical protein
MHPILSDTTITNLLLDLARREDDLAAAEALGTPYWRPCPESVVGHRAAAKALRRHAESFRAAS